MINARTSIPHALKLDVLTRNRHRCCVCYQEQVILHHIDKNHDNNVAVNLAVLCLHHHGLAHAHFHLAQNYTEETIRNYKKDWEAHIAGGRPLPPVVTEPFSSRLAQQYERQQTALRIVFAEELLADYRIVLERYILAGGKQADQVIHDASTLPRLRTSRWDTLCEIGHLQEYIELMARTYAAIEHYNNCLSTPLAVVLPARDWADYNLRVGTAIAASLTPLLASLDRPGIALLQDFKDPKFLTEFPQE